MSPRKILFICLTQNKLQFYNHNIFHCLHCFVELRRLLIFVFFPDQVDSKVSDKSRRTDVDPAGGLQRLRSDKRRRRTNHR